MSVSRQEQARIDYDKSATVYNSYGLTPYGQLESQLIEVALGDCAGLSVLDLGGGTGIHAREAIDLGASKVDVVDISGEMLKIAEETARSQGQQYENTIRYFEADVSKPLDNLPLQTEGYDVVMANWIFTFTDQVEVLEGMFHNIVGYLKPGGKFIGARDAGPRNLDLEKGKYGISCRDLEEIPGGLRYTCVIHSTPPMEWQSTSLEVIWSGSTELYEKAGLSDVKLVPYQKAAIVQKDPDFWQPFLERPSQAVIQAVKK
ncbi:hypothetical protein PT974_12334 [Cladobotryum mycophilum]|uniref:Methyltransferase domain-containing protein n=1 Tax=Cladobotryum mycophilum TaxID=491253 RepID=A0ABR0S7Q1_9HYPO